MSFILDALRKSESERQREAAPSLSQIPIAAPRSGLPPWAWAVIAALGLSVFVLAAAWWQSAANAPTVEAAASRADPVRGTLPGADPEQSAPPAGAPAVARAPAQEVPVPSAGAAGRTLPTLEEVLAAGMALPPLELQLHSYSEDSAERFVFINGFQYRQGQRVQNGPLIVGIYAEGVVLRHEGRDFVLLRE
jgi:general secretion pathway protein B